MLFNLMKGKRLTRVDGRARAGVLEARVVDGLGEESVAELVCAREADTSRVCGTSTSDLDLEAGDVWLGVSGTGVQSDGLGTDEVVACSNRLGDSEGTLSAVGVEDLCSPRGDSSSVAILCDLKEGTGGGGLCVSDLGHVDENRPVVVASDGRLATAAVTGLSMHLYGEGTAG